MAHDLRFYRKRARLSGEDFGRIMGVVRSTVSRMESGEYKISDDHAEALDKYFDTGGHFLRLLTYARTAHDPEWYKPRLDLEQQASIISVYENVLIPGLLQTREYATALITVGGGDVEQQVDERMARQELFDREPPLELWAIVNECVLHQLIGGRDVMRAQLSHLITVSAQPNVVIRVVPRSVGAHFGVDGTFAIMCLETGDVAYVQAPGGGRLARSAADVRAFGIRYDRIGQQAQPEGPSRDLIEQAMENL